MAQALIISLDLCQTHLCEESALIDKKKTRINLELHFQLLKKIAFHFENFQMLREAGGTSVSLSPDYHLGTSYTPASSLSLGSCVHQDIAGTYFMRFLRPGHFPKDSVLTHNANSID